jgi:hypothetical protein
MTADEVRAAWESIKRRASLQSTHNRARQAGLHNARLRRGGY